jgi:spermidine synthase
VYAVLLARKLPRRAWAMAGLVAVLAVAVVRIPKNERFWTIFGGLHVPEERYFNENATGISMIKMRKPDEPPATSYCNGMGQSHLPYAEDFIHVRLGVIPSLLHPKPQDVAVIGLGSGGTLFGIGCRKETESLTCFEVMTNEPKVLRDYAAGLHDVAIPTMLDDPRLKMRFQDGREALQNESRLYDVIEADPPYPNRGFAGNLYSLEYFKLLKSRLKPGGLAVSWDPPKSRVCETFCAVFPWVYEAGGYILIGSSQPLPQDEVQLEARAQDASAIAYLANAGIPIEAVTHGHLLRVRTIQQERPTTPLEFNTDMVPKDEFVNPLTLLQKGEEPVSTPKAARQRS